MSEMRIEIVRDDDQRFVIDNQTWMIGSDDLENFATLPQTVTAENNAMYDGGVITNTRVGTIDRSVHAEMLYADDIALARHQVLSFFLPKRNYSVYVVYQGIERKFTGVQYAFKMPTGNTFSSLEFDWTILCPMPYMESVDDYGKDVASITGKIGFQLHSVIKTNVPKVYARGFVAGAYAFGKHVMIENDGDVETYLRVVVKCSGAVKDPVITINGNSVFYLGNLVNGDELSIDFVNRPPRIEVNGKNGMKNVSKKSSFTGFVLPVGFSDFTYSAATGENVMSVSLYYNKRYVGI